jgi:hypothetical protein
MPVTETAIKEREPMASAPEILPRDTSWFPSGSSDSVAPAVAQAQNVPPPAAAPQLPPSDPPSRGPIDTPRVPIAVGREAMPTPRELDASALRSAADPPRFDGPEPPTRPGTAAVAESAIVSADAHTPRAPEGSAAAREAATTPESPRAAAPSAPDGGVSPAVAAPRAAEARAPAPRVVPRPKLDSKTEPSQPKAALKQEFKKPELQPRPKQEAPKPELQSRPKQEFKKPEFPSRPKQEAPKPQLQSRPKQEAPKPELQSRPKQEAPKPELQSRPKQEAPKPELQSRPKQESRPDLDRQTPPPRPKQESRPDLDRQTPPPRPKQESRPNLGGEPPLRPRQESRPRFESSPEDQVRARAVAAEAVAKALASTEAAPAPASQPMAPPAAASFSAVSAVPAVPEPRPISLPPVRPSLPPGRRWAFIGGLAAVLVVSLVVLGWLLSTVSSKSDLPVTSASAPIASAAPAPEPTAQEEEEEEEAVAPSPPSTGESQPVPAGSSPGLLEQAVANLNSQAGGDGKTFDRDAALKALDAAANRASRCRSKGDPSGNVTVLVIFNPSGTVKEAKVVDTRYDGRPTARCIASRMAQARIRPFEGTPKTLAKSVVIP